MMLCLTPLRTAALAAVLGAAALTLPALAAPAAPSSRVALPPIPGEVIVKFKASADTVRRHALSARTEATAVPAALQARAANLGSRTGQTLEAGSAVGERTQVVRASGVDATTLAALLAADPDVEYAVPNGRKRRMAGPNDPYYLAGPAINGSIGGPVAGQWYLRAPTPTLRSSIDIETAWLRSSGSSSVVVAVLDTGVRGDHPDLTGRLAAGYDFVSNNTIANDGDGRDADPSDPGDWVTTTESHTSTFTGCAVESSSWHGTATASLVGAATDNGVGMAGVAPGVRILPVRVLGKCYGDDADILAGMRWAAGIHVDGVPDNPNPAKVLNMSLGGGTVCEAAYQAAINEVRAAGAVVVVAGGNSSGGPVSEPANCTGVISVLALRHTGTKVGFSDLGPQITIAAPGGNCVNSVGPCLYPILAATNDGTQGPTTSSWTDAFNYSVGTSFAAPLTAGVVALMISVQPALTPDQLSARMQASAREFPSTGSESANVAQCHAPSSNVEQLECYCTTTLCGAGMLDAGRAVQAAGNALARIDLVTTSPMAGSPVTLTAANSLPTAGSSIVGYAWTLVNGGGIVTAISGSTSSATVTLTPSAAGTFTVSVAVSDGQGNTSLAQQAVTVAAAPVTPPPAGGGGGGGALSPMWLLALALGTAGLAAKRRP